jgi:hypothetical protein
VLPFLVSLISRARQDHSELLRAPHAQGWILRRFYGDCPWVARPGIARSIFAQVPGLVADFAPVAAKIAIKPGKR